MYIINFADSAGYVMMTADNRVPEQILTFSDNGYIGDTIDNPGMALFMSYAEDYIINSIAKAEAERDSITAVIKAKLDVILAEETTTKGIPPIDPGWSIEGDVRTYEEWEPLRRTSEVAPLIPVEWDQRDPFNYYVKAFNCTKINPDTPVGCVAVALGQLMAYWKHPSSYGAITFDWNTLNKYTGVYSYGQSSYKTWEGSMRYDARPYLTNQVANLMKIIGEEVSMIYSCEESSAPVSKGMSFLQRLGYNASTTSYNYYFNTVTNSTSQGRPIIISGCSYSNNTACHAWIIDGYIIGLQRYKQIQVITDQRTGQSRSTIIDDYDVAINMIHCNWGWDGQSNGYFASGCFDAKNGAGYTKVDSDKNYKYGVQIYPYISH